MPVKYVVRATPPRKYDPTYGRHRDFVDRPKVAGVQLNPLGRPVELDEFGMKYNMPAIHKLLLSGSVTVDVVETDASGMVRATTPLVPPPAVVAPFDAGLKPSEPVVTEMGESAFKKISTLPAGVTFLDPSDVSFVDVSLVPATPDMVAIGNVVPVNTVGLVTEVIPDPETPVPAASVEVAPAVIEVKEEKPAEKPVPSFGNKNDKNRRK